jgi:hypothetical protein
VIEKRPISPRRHGGRKICQIELANLFTAKAAKIAKELEF